MDRSTSSNRRARRSRVACRASFAAIVALAVVPATGSPATRHRGCDFANRLFASVMVINSRSDVSCARAKQVVRDYIRQVHGHEERDHVVDSFHIRWTGHGRYVAVRPGDEDARFVWITFLRIDTIVQ
jgi:hypothetical protein